MLCYVMLCYVMLCYVMLCYVMLCYVMLCYVMLCYVMLCYVMLCYVMLCYVMLICHDVTMCYPPKAISHFFTFHILLTTLIHRFTKEYKRHLVSTFTQPGIYLSMIGYYHRAVQCGGTIVQIM